MTRDPQHFQFHSATEQWLSASFSHWNQLEPLWKRCLSLIPSLLNHLPRWTETPPRCGGLWFRLHRQSEKGQEDSGSLFKSCQPVQVWPWLQAPRCCSRKGSSFVRSPGNLSPLYRCQLYSTKYPPASPAKKPPNVMFAATWQNTSWSVCIWWNTILRHRQPFLNI